MASDRTGVRRHDLWRRLRKQRVLQLMALPALVLLILFRYIPMFGLQIAFKEFMFNKGMLWSPWVGLKHFRDFFTDPYIVGVLVNTMGISLLKVFLMFPVPIILALLLNEVRSAAFKRVTQTISYFPYFISWVVVALMARSWLAASGGLVNDILMAAGVLRKPFLFLGEPNAFWWIALVLEIWKNAGWGSIIYLAAISGIDPELYEAADMDGARRVRKMVSITIPSILGTVMILFILNIGYMLSGGLYGSNFEQSYLLSNPLNLPRSEILDTYILRIGVSLGRYSYATAVGLLQGVVSFVLLLAANTGSRRLTGESFL
jgi:putative aldouronate transport system permease protein